MAIPSATSTNIPISSPAALIDPSAIYQGQRERDATHQGSHFSSITANPFIIFLIYLVGCLVLISLSLQLLFFLRNTNNGTLQTKARTNLLLTITFFVLICSVLTYLLYLQ